MDKMKNIIAISGSTRQKSVNLNLIMAIADLASANFNITVYEKLSELPHFNPDFDDENVSRQVVDFRNKLKKADGILICTPEYAKGVPGTLKNAIDWTVSSGEFSKKPTALITASSLGENGHISLFETLEMIEADITDKTQLLISYAKTKINTDNKIIDDKTLSDVNDLINSFCKLIKKE